MREIHKIFETGWCRYVWDSASGCKVCIVCRNLCEVRELAIGQSDVMKATDVLWKRYQTRVDDETATDDAIRRRSADQLHEDYQHLEHRVDKLTLISRAMWELLTEAKDWNEEKLFSKMKEIDGRDGAVDGKIEAKVVTCPECGHPVNTRNPRCVYCGYREFKSDPFVQV